MAYQQFIVTDTNPNDSAGGGGCICDPTRQIDCKPPYVVFYGNEMENNESPHPVLCKSCIDAAQAACNGEILSAGEQDPRTLDEAVAETYGEHELPPPVAPEDADVPEV